MKNNSIRKLPPVCLAISIFRLAIGNLRYSNIYKGKAILMDDGSVFTIFRHISTPPTQKQESLYIPFIVRFKFARLSHKANKIASIIPMLIITGYPGFISKIYAVDKSDGSWQGMYQWMSKGHLESYKKSLVFRIMNKRAIKDSIAIIDVDDQNLNSFISDRIIDPKTK